MEITLGLILEIISSVGFPIAVAIALGWFVWRIYKKSEEREDAMREELKESREINSKFADVISKYSVEIGEIKTDVKQIKEDVLVITEHFS